MLLLDSLGASFIWRASSLRQRWVSPPQFPIYSLKLTRPLRPSWVMAPTMVTQYPSRIGQAAWRPCCRATAPDSVVLSRRRHSARRAQSSHRTARANCLAKED